MTSYDGQDTYIIQLIAVSLSVLVSIGNSIFRELMVYLGNFFKFERRTYFNIEVAKGNSIA